MIIMYKSKTYCVYRNRSCEVNLRKRIQQLYEKRIIVISVDSTNDEIKSNEENKISHDNSDDSNEYYIKDKDYDLLIPYLSYEKEGKKRKDVPHANTREDIKRLKLDSSYESLDEINSMHDYNVYTKDTIKSKGINWKDKVSNDVSVNIMLNSAYGEFIDSHSEEGNGSKLAVSLAKQETGVGNLNLVVAQERSLTTGNVHLLQDKSTAIKNEKFFSKRESMFFNEDTSFDEADGSYFDIDDIPTEPTVFSELKKLDSLISYSPNERKGKKWKDIIHDNIKDDIKGLELNSSNESLDEIKFLHDHNICTKNTTEFKGLNLEDETSKKNDVSATIMLDSDTYFEENSESELTVFLAKQEIGVGNMNPVVAQKMITCKLQSLQDKLAATKLILNDVEVLEDKGEKLRESVQEYEKEIELLKLELKNTSLAQNSDIKETVVKNEPSSSKKKSMFKDDSNFNRTDHSYLNIDNIPMELTTSPELKDLDEKAQETRNKELALTVERLQDLHGSLVARPTDDEKAEDPRGLKVPLMPHQKHALAWLLWREQQKPPGGVLADDMGLGKTVTMISLILATLGEKNFSDESDDSDGESSQKKPLRYVKGGTLIICPASILSQWEKEVINKCKHGLLTVQVYYGSNRQNIRIRLTKNNIVITTYNIIAREFNSASTLFKIQWKRVILDEAHIIRNHKTQAAIAVCELIADKRWALTGTPIHNKKMDLYSILKFLQCTPFNDLRVWRRWVENGNEAGHQRLSIVMKTLMLRRTKEELQSQGCLESLPYKCVEEVTVNLAPQEQLVHETILIYSRTLFAQFLAQRTNKMFGSFDENCDALAFLSPNINTQFTKAQKMLLATHANVKAYEIFVLLLRLRQVCCHPALIHAMLDQEEMQVSGIMNVENMSTELMSQLNNVLFHIIDNHESSEKEEEEIDVEHKIVQNVLTAKNPVFDDDRISSKMQALLDIVEKILQTKDKLIIVSQWTTLLDIIASHLELMAGATFVKFTGKIVVKDRPAIVEAFNKPNCDPRILLLSLTAGGVGLNLMGGNHLLLFDNHWNPQLEMQAQGRIFRFGQKKNVHIYKFICSNTIEERIKALQERKLAIAQNVLSGDKSKEAKLTLNDLKLLFAL